jgi:hypothetical protein
MSLPFNATAHPMLASRLHQFRPRLRDVLLVLAAVNGSRSVVPAHGPASVAALRR